MTHSLLPKRIEQGGPGDPYTYRYVEDKMPHGIIVMVCPVCGEWGRHDIEHRPECSVPAVPDYLSVRYATRAFSTERASQ